MSVENSISHRGSRGLSIAISVLIILLGLLALALPFVAGLAVAAMFAWGLILAGILHFVYGWNVRGAGAHIWEFLVGLVYVVGGVYTLADPLAGLVGLTMVLGTYLLFKGCFEIAGGLIGRHIPGSGWLLVDAIVSLTLAGIIWSHVLASATWVIGTLLGFSILFTGVSRLLLTLSTPRDAEVM